MGKYEIALSDYMENRDTGFITIDKVLKIMSNVYEALEQLHSVGYVHNDLKPSNIMLDNNLDATLIDLGFTSQFMDTKTGEHFQQV